MALVLPNTLAPGAYENAADYQADFVAVRNYLNGSLDGSVFADTASAQLSVDEFAIERRGSLSTAIQIPSTTVGGVTVMGRVPAIVMAASGILWVSATAYMDVETESIFGNGQYSYEIRLNGVTARSRFGAVPASGVSGGLLRYVSPDPITDGARHQIYTENTDPGIFSLFSTDGGGGSLPTSSILGTFLPIAVDPGAYTVDFIQKTESYTPGSLDQSGDTIRNAKLFVKSEAY